MHCRLQATTMCMGWQLCGLVGACLGWRASNSKPLWLLLCSEGQSIQQLLETNTIWRPLYPALCASRAAASQAPASGPAKVAAVVHRYQSHVSAPMLCSKVAVKPKSVYSAVGPASRMLSIDGSLVYCSRPSRLSAGHN